MIVPVSLFIASGSDCGPGLASRLDYTKRFNTTSNETEMRIMHGGVVHRVPGLNESMIDPMPNTRPIISRPQNNRDQLFSDRQ